jgi:hypothetical protein
VHALSVGALGDAVYTDAAETTATTPAKTARVGKRKAESQCNCGAGAGFAHTTRHTWSGCLYKGSKTKTSASAPATVDTTSATEQTAAAGGGPATPQPPIEATPAWALGLLARMDAVEQRSYSDHGHDADSDEYTTDDDA